MAIDNTNVTNYARFDSFAGGENTSSSKQFVAEAQFVDGNNITNDIAPILKSRWGKKKHCTTPFANTIHTLKCVDLRGGLKSLIVGSHLDVYVDWFFLGNFELIKTLGASRPLRGPEIGKYWYFCNGNDLKKFDGTTVTNWSMYVPYVVPTATPTGSGTFASTNGYIYGYTYRRDTLEAETDMASSVTTGAFVSKSYCGVLVTASTDAQVSGINLYRTLDGGTEFYLVAQLANTTATYHDDMNDTVLRENETFASEYNRPSDKYFSDAVFLNGRVIGFTAGNAELCYSKIGYPEAFPGEYQGYTYPIYNGKGNIGQRVSKLGTTLVAFKNKSIVAVYNTDVESPLSFSYDVVSENVGLYAKESLASGKYGGTDALFFLGSDLNLWAFTASGMKDLTAPIRTLFRGVPQENFLGMVGWYHDDKYFISFPFAPTSTENDCVFYLDCKNGGWFPYTKDWGVVAAYDFEGKNYVATSKGYIELIDVYGLCSDNGNNYDMQLITRWHAGTLPEKLKKWWTLGFEGIWSSIQLKLRLSNGAVESITPLEGETDVTGGWDLVEDVNNNWDALWDGQWNGVEYHGAWDGVWDTVAFGQRGYEQTLPQGLKSKYISAIVELPVTGNEQSEIHSLSIGYSLEK